MSKIRITFEFLTLVINRPERALVVLPRDKHKAVVDLPNGTSETLDQGTEVQLLDANGEPFDGAPSRPASEYVVHLDNVFKRRVEPLDELLVSTPSFVNARFLLNGGGFTGLELRSLPELAWQTWDFTTRIGTGDERVHHSQKVSDVVQYSIDVPQGEYILRIGAHSHPFRVGRADAEISVRNDDDCNGRPRGPRFILQEYQAIYALTDRATVSPEDRPVPVAEPDSFKVPESLVAKDPRLSCDLVCGNAQCG